MSKSQKTFLFIDGSNLYGSQYTLCGPYKYLNFSLFIKHIENSLEITFDRIYFYASFSPKPKYPSQKQKQYLKNEGLFYKTVRQTKKVIFFKGYRSPTSGKEKEVDVKLASDIVHLAHLNLYNNLYFYSADADFAHALLIAKLLKKKVFILALENRIPHRFIYLFPTYVLSFKKVLNFQQSKKQKIKIIRLLESCVNQI